MQDLTELIDQQRSGWHFVEHLDSMNCHNSSAISSTAS